MVTSYINVSTSDDRIAHNSNQAQDACSDEIKSQIREPRSCAKWSCHDVTNDQWQLRYWDTNKYKSNKMTFDSK